LRREKRQRLHRQYLFFVRAKQRHELRQLRRSHRRKVRRGEIIFRP
jgi:hypothetical protein